MGRELSRAVVCRDDAGRSAAAGLRPQRFWHRSQIRAMTCARTCSGEPVASTTWIAGSARAIAR